MKKRRPVHEAVVMESDGWGPGAFGAMCLESGAYHEAWLGDEPGLAPLGIDRCVAYLDTWCNARHAHATRAVATRKGTR